MKHARINRWGMQNFHFRIHSGKGPAICLLSPRLRRFPNQTQNQGQALVEYVLLLAVAAGLAVALNASFGAILGKGILGFNTVLQRELSSGNFPEQNDSSIWKGDPQ
jgi:hypothetical protein